MKPLISLSLLLTASAAFAAPGPWKGTISMYVQDYTPNYPGAASKLKAFQQLADAYQKANPGILIKFSTTPVPDNDTMVRVKAAAGELFDIYWAQADSLNSTLPKGVATDLAPYFRQPNPYIPGNTAWQDVMNKAVLAETTAPGGAVYELSGDQVAYTIFYNKDLFKKAGVIREPTTWSELVAAARKIKAAGIEPMHAVPAYPWWSHHFMTDLYSTDYVKLTSYDKAPGQSPLDEAAAIQQGILTPKDTRFMDWWPTFKQFTDTWPKDYLTADPAKNYDAFQDFVGGKEAMIYEGSYKAREMRDAGIKFPIGSFNFPRLSAADVKGATGVYTGNAYSGTGSFQFAVSTSKSNRTMTPEKLAAVVDWMRYFGTPANLQKIVSENGSYVPSWPGTKAQFAPNFDSAALKQQVAQPNRAIGVGNASPNLGWGDLQKIFGLYLSGNITLPQAKSQAQTMLDRAAQDYARKNKIDLSQFK